MPVTRAMRILARMQSVAYRGLFTIAMILGFFGCSQGSNLERAEEITDDFHMVGTIKNGKKHGKWVTYSEGELWNIVHWRDGKVHGPYSWWLGDNGSMSSDGMHKNGVPHGRTRIFYRPGQLAELGWYRHGKRERTWCSWNPDGTLQYIKIFQQDKLMREDLNPPGQCPLIFGDGERHLDPKDKNVE